MNLIKFPSINLELYTSKIAFSVFGIGVYKYAICIVLGAILGLILFTVSLVTGIVKESWVKPACELFINNMSMFLVPLFCGLIVYKSIIAKNWIAIFIIIFLTTTIVIIFTGLFTEWGIKLLRLNNIKTYESENE